MKSLVSKLFHKASGGEHRIIKKKLHAPDRWLLFAIVVVSIFGLLMVYDSSVAIALRDFSNQYYFVVEQAKWLLLGFVACFVFSLVDYHLWQRFALPLLFVTIGLLLAVFLPGIGLHILGARRWLSFGFFVFQPAELAKLTLVIYLSAWFANKEKGRLIPFLLLLCMIVGLVVLEPDLGTSLIVLGIALVLYFFSGAPTRQFLLLFPILFLVVAVLAIVSPYRLSRLTTFLHPETDPQGASYQIRQVLLALGSGGWFGVGIGKSRQKYEYLPEANTDSIFAIIGEEIGFIGGVATITLFLFIVWRGFRIAKRAPDPFGRFLALGISSWIALQTLVNLASMVALVPLTGVPLPLVSYGGSGLIILLSGIGMLVNISRQ